MSVRMFKYGLLGCLVAGLLVTLSGTPQTGNDSGAIWSSREAAFAGRGDAVDEGIYTMRGAEPAGGVDYDGSSPLNSSGRDYDFKAEIDDSICELESAMEESVEIMRSLRMESAGMLEGDVAGNEPGNTGGMEIDDFEMQQLQFDQECISRSGGLDNKIIAKVDISVPSISSRAVVDEDELREVKRLRQLGGELDGVVSSATLKVTEILFDHGEDERALGMLEKELQEYMVN